MYHIRNSHLRNECSINNFRNPVVLMQIKRRFFIIGGDLKINTVFSRFGHKMFKHSYFYLLYIWRIFTHLR